MSGPLPNQPNPHRDDWDEYDWERFLQRADTRAAKFQELFETLLDHPDRDKIIATEMGWDRTRKSMGCEDRDCSTCDRRFECESYELLRMTEDPEDWTGDPEACDLLASFEEVKSIEAYRLANDFAALFEDYLRERAPEWIADEEVREALFAAQMVPAKIAGGHGIGYDRDALCGNIANCKRADRDLRLCIERIEHVLKRGILHCEDTAALLAEAKQAQRALDRWIENLRAKVWWR